VPIEPGKALIIAFEGCWSSLHKILNLLRLTGKQIHELIVLLANPSSLFK